MPEGHLRSQASSLEERLETVGYIADRTLATTLDLVVRLGRPLLLEGDAGVGKTEVAKAMSQVFGCELIRLQCYEGLDASSAVYEWNYQHQLLTIKLQEQERLSLQERESEIFSERFLLARPLLKAIQQSVSPVLLIDEIDRADEEFEAYLLELLSDFQISVPELGTIRAVAVPYVILTSNGTRELSDALRRRCLYHYLDYPNPEKELRIVESRLPQIDARLAREVVAFVQNLRGLELRKQPGVAETLDWAAALIGLSATGLRDHPEQVVETLACLLKTRDDVAAVDDETVTGLLRQAAP